VPHNPAAAGYAARQVSLRDGRVVDDVRGAPRARGARS
jgi:hypothetical protein